MSDSIFTKIIKGQVPCHKIYEDDRTLAMLDIHPVQPGQVLVVSKVQVDHVWDLTDEDYAALWETVKKVGRRLRQCYPHKARVAVIVEGIEVAHAHVKVFPFTTDEEFRLKPDMHLQPSHEELAKLAQTLAF